MNFHVADIEVTCFKDAYTFLGKLLESTARIISNVMVSCLKMKKNKNPGSALVFWSLNICIISFGGHTRCYISTPLFSLNNPKCQTFLLSNFFLALTNVQQFGKRWWNIWPILTKTARKDISIFQLKKELQQH